MEAIERILDVNAALRRMRNGWRTMVARGDIPTLVIACLLVLIPVMGLNAGLGDFTRQASPRVVTTWPISLSQLIPVAVLSVIFGFALARSHYSEGLALLLSGIYSIGITLLIQIFAAPGNLIQRVIAVAIRLSYAISATLSGSVDPFFLIIFLSLLVWFLGHNTAWHIFRLDRIWRAILPPAVVLVLNNFFNAALNLDYYLITFLFLALLLVVRSHIEAREYDWYINRIRFQGNLRDWFFRGGALLGVLMLVFAWNLPTGSAIENQKKFSDFLNGDLARRVQDLMNRLLSPIEG
ncbi:MAG TPA: hypothetical protein VMT34_07880, partial [Aggregatilineales bacterium]|nr:hypothetical protein [Aggregatilineales bacterium]